MNRRITARILGATTVAVLLCGLTACANQGKVAQPKDPRYLEVAQLLEKRDFAKAEPLVDKLLDERPNDTWSHYYAGVLANKQRRFQDATEQLSRAVELAPRNAEAYSERSYTDKQTGNLDQALRDIDDAIALDGSKALNFHRRGLVELGLKKYKEAIADFSQSEKIDPKDYPFYIRFNRAEAYIGLKDYPQALKNFESAAQLPSENPTALLVRRAYCKLNMRDLKGAEADCRAVLKKEPNNSGACTVLGASEVLGGDVTAAKGQFKQAILNDKGYLGDLADAGATGGESPVAVLAETYIDLNQPTEAETLFTKIQSKRPLEATEQFQLARAYLALNQGPRAEKLLNTCISNDPTDMRPRLELIRYYREEGLASKADELAKETAGLGNKTH